MEPETNEPNNAVSKLVPSSQAYAFAFAALFFGGLAGTFIGYALMEVFFPSASGMLQAIGTLIICALIIYGINVIVSLSLQASVEWKARSMNPTKKRPSRFIREI